MRIASSSCVMLTVVLGLLVASSRDARSIPASEKPDPFTVNSVWQGTCDQSQPKLSYPMVLFVNKRNGDTFEGMTWYPTLKSGVIKVIGRIDAQGAVTFTEEEVIYGGVTMRRPDGVVPGTTYKASTDGTTLNGTGEYIDSSTTDSLTFSLKLSN